MDRARWERVKEVFEAASCIDSDDRSLFLLRACAGDERLLAEVERLLLQSAAADEYFRTPTPASPVQMPEVPQNFSDGQVVCQRFVIRRFVGRGGMGEVYAADDKVTGVTVAIKAIRGEIDGDERLRAAFRKEVQLARKITHGNVCRIHDLFEHCVEQVGGTPVRRVQILSMELLEGETLADLFKKRHRFAVSEAIPILRQIAEGLAAVHRAGVIHRDLKPSNIILTSSESWDLRVVLTDFGLARGDFEDSLWSGKSGSVAIVGTPKYMSPEQLQGSTAAVASDIYALGAIWYEMLTGHSPHEFRTATIGALTESSDHVPSPRTFVPDLDNQIEKAMLKCLEREPSHRFMGAPNLLAWFEIYAASHSPQPVAAAGRCFGADMDGRFRTSTDHQAFLLEAKDELDTRKLPLREAPPRKGERKWLIAGLCVIAFAIAGSLLLYPPSHSTQIEPRVIPVVSYPGFQRDPAFSPDGNQIAFAWTGRSGTTTHIYVKVIGTDAPLQLTSGRLSDTHPAWAPDGRSIAFLRALSDVGTGIYQVAPLGGADRRIAEVRAGLYPALSWSHDSKFLVTTGRKSPDARSQIFVISAESGEQRPLSFGNQRDEFYPALSPDSQFLAFSRMYGDADWAIFTVPVDGNLQPTGALHRVSTPYGLNRQSAWTADGKELIFANGGSATRLWRASAHSDMPARRLPATGEIAYQPAVAPTGNRLAYAHDFNNANIWSVAVTVEGKAEAPALVMGSARSSWIRPNAISPDNQRIAFESNRSGPYGVWISDVNGSNARLVFGGLDYISGSPAWSPDGRWLAFDTRKDRKVQIYAIPAEGGVARRVTRTEADNLVPYWSRDGKWIYFCSNRTGRFEVFKVSPEGGSEVQVTQNGGWAPQESPDCKFLLYTRRRAASTPLLKVPVNGGREVQILPSVHERWWAAGDKGVWYMQYGGGEIEPDLWPLEIASTERGYLRFLRFATGNVRTARIISKTPAGGLAMSGDRRTLMFSQVDHRATEILLMENFR